MSIPVYVPTDWENLPAGGTPIDMSNLGNMEMGIKIVTDEIINLRERPTKASQTEFGIVTMWTTTSGGTNNGFFGV